MDAFITLANVADYYLNCTAQPTYDYSDKYNQLAARPKLVCSPRNDEAKGDRKKNSPSVSSHILLWSRQDSVHSLMTVHYLPQPVDSLVNPFGGICWPHAGFS
jgi:hypothetical protein